MKPTTILVIVAVLFVVGAAGGYYLLTQSGSAESGDQPQQAVEPVADDSTDEGAVDQPGGASQHGKAIEIPDNPTMCKIHHVPEVVDPFCNSDLVESRGWCGGHDVAEALCTRCSPVLIAAFKAEGDWCAEHGLPESQCITCNPELDEG